MKYAISIFLMALSLVISCGGESPTDPGNEEVDYYPRNVGDLWEYEFSGTTTTPSKEVYTTVGTQSDYIHGTVQHSLGFQVLSCEWARTLYWYDEDDICVDTTYQGADYYQHITNDAVYEYTSLSDSNPSIYLMIPPELGDFWYPTPGESTSEIVSVDATTSTPLGTFSSCAQKHWELLAGDESRDFWYAPDVGWASLTGYHDSETYTENWAIQLTQYSQGVFVKSTHTVDTSSSRYAGCGELFYVGDLSPEN